MRLEDNEIRLDYRIRSTSREREAFLWALHPLLKIVEGDRIELPGDVGFVRVESAEGLRDMPHGSIRPWPGPIPGVELDQMNFGAHGPACAKLFAESPSEGRAAIVNSQTRESIILEFDLQQTPVLGVWLTRGGWNGYEHVALEPTNYASDSLAEAASAPTPALTLPPGGEKAWTIECRLERLQL